MAKEGKHSVASAHHGREGWKRWRQDNSKATEKSTAVRIWIPVLRQILLSPETSADECVLAVPDDFKSFISELRPDPGSSWGYLVVPRVQQSRPGVESNLFGVPSGGSAAGTATITLGSRDRRLRPGNPDIDSGAIALIPLDIDHSGCRLNQLDEIHDPYSRVLNDSGKLLEEYDYIRKGSVPSRDPRTTMAKGAVDNLRRKTIDVSPGISRAIELMMKAGKVAQARGILEKLQFELAGETEKVFPQGRVIACAWHCNSGMPTKPGILHLDVWMHSTQLETRVLGTKKTLTLVRTWEDHGLDHCGPGSGICAWDRHMNALGGEMEKLAPGICYEVRKAIKFHEKRAISRNRPGSANRDIRLHRKFDELLRRDLPAEFVEAGMAEYRTHLRQVYEGGDLKILQAASDPEKFEKRKKFLEDTMQEVALREAALEKKLARMATESSLLVAEKARREGRRYVEQKVTTRTLGRKIGVLLAQANITKNDAVADRENFRLQSDDLKEQAELLNQGFEQERRKARLEGVNDARRLVLGTDAPEPLSMPEEQLGAVFRKEISDHVDSKVIKKLDDTRRRLAGLSVSLPDVHTVEEVEDGISHVLKVREDYGIVVGLKTVFSVLNEGVEPSGGTAAEILKEITTAITRTIISKIMGVLRCLRPDYESAATTLAEFDDEIGAGVRVFETKARESGLEEARRALVGADAPALEIANETTLRESIQIASEQLKTTAGLDVAAALMGEKLEKVVAGGGNPVKLVVMEFTRLREVESIARELATTAPAASMTSVAGRALSRLRKMLKIAEPGGDHGGYGD